jgi:hypothetical protein
MTELHRYWTRRKWKALRFLIFIAAAVVIAFAVLISAFLFTAWLSSLWPGATSTERLQILSFVVNAILTAILVGATCLYAWLTWRMVRELVESRRVGKRPSLAIDLGHLEISRPEGETYMWLACPIRIANFGGGPAIFPSGTITMPARQPSAGIPWLREGVQASIPELPEVLPTTGQVSGTVRLLADIYEVSLGHTLEFASVRLKFEDAERNLFNQVHTFNIFHDHGRYYWGLAFERLTMIPFSKRSHIGDESLRMSFSDDSSELIYERAGTY